VLESLEVMPAEGYTLMEVADLMNRGFADYMVRIALSRTTLLHMVRQDSVDLSSSRVVRRDGEPVGAGLIARRGWSSRLAGMAIVPEARGDGVGSWLMERLIAEAKARGERAMVLEVIEQNTAAVRLYEKCGFRVQRRLLGYVGSALEGTIVGELEEVDVRELGRMVTAHGLPDLPWQISGETLAQMGPPTRAYRLGAAYVAVADPDRAQMAIRAVLVKPEARRQGEATRLLQALIARYPGRIWRVAPLCPEEIGGLFDGAGFERESLAQLQMILDLRGN